MEPMGTAHALAPPKLRKCPKLFTRATQEEPLHRRGCCILGIMTVGSGALLLRYRQTTQQPEKLIL